MYIALYTQLIWFYKTLQNCRPVKEALDVVYMIVSSFTKKSPKCSLLLAHISDIMLADED